jgi:hypothetical protein
MTINRKLPSSETLLSPQSKSQQRRKFLYYCCFAFGLPLTLAVGAMAVDLSSVENVVRPNFGMMSCWFYGTATTWFSSVDILHYKIPVYRS